MAKKKALTGKANAHTKKTINSSIGHSPFSVNTFKTKTFRDILSKKGALK